ncbi:MAG: S41 family peptidase [Rhodospirillales bacterium]
MRQIWNTAALCLPLALFMPVVAMGDEISDLAAQVAAAGHDVPPASVLRHACDTDPLCVARFLKDRIGAGAALLPDTGMPGKSAGWHSRQALHRVVNDMNGSLFIVPARFDAKAILNALDAADGVGMPIARVVLDLREINDANNLDAMRRVASLFTGKQDRAFTVEHSTGRAVDWTIPKPLRRLGTLKLEVWADADIDGATEALAALLREHAGASILGEPTHNGGFLLERLAVTPGWALQVPTGRVSIPGQDLSLGLIPDTSIPD